MHANVGVEDPQDRMFGIMLQPSHMARASERTMCTRSSPIDRQGAPIDIWNIVRRERSLAGTTARRRGRMDSHEPPRRCRSSQARREGARRSRRPDAHWRVPGRPRQAGGAFYARHARQQSSKATVSAAKLSMTGLTPNALQRLHNVSPDQHHGRYSARATGWGGSGGPAGGAGSSSSSSSRPRGTNSQSNSRANSREDVPGSSPREHRPPPFQMSSPPGSRPRGATGRLSTGSGGGGGIGGGGAHAPAANSRQMLRAAGLEPPPKDPRSTTPTDGLVAPPPLALPPGAPPQLPSHHAHARDQALPLSPPAPSPRHAAPLLHVPSHDVGPTGEAEDDAEPLVPATAGSGATAAAAGASRPRPPTSRLRPRPRHRHRGRACRRA